MTDNGAQLSTKLGAMDLMTGAHYREATTQNAALNVGNQVKMQPGGKA